jgi:hypothetical protein
MADWNPPQSDLTKVSDHWRDRRSKPRLLLISLLTALILPLTLFYAVVVVALLFKGFIGGQPP